MKNQNFDPVVLKLEDLNLDEKNSVSHDKFNIESIKSSLKRFGQYRAFVIQKKTNKIIVGNGMCVAMRELGIKEGTGIILDISDEEAELLGATDNKLGELHDWEFDNLKSILSNQKSEELIEMGWDSYELDALLNSSNMDTPNFSEDSDDYLDDLPEVGKDKNKGKTVKFTEHQWNEIRDSINKIQEEIGTTSEEDAIFEICKWYGKNQ